MKKIIFMYDEIISNYITEFGNTITFVKPNLSNYNFYSFWDDYELTKDKFVNKFNRQLNNTEDYHNDNDIKEFLINNFNHQNAQIIFDNTYENIELVSYNDINDTDNYIYPIFFYTQDFHTRYDDLIIPNNILNLIYQDRCKILFMQHMEANFGMEPTIYKWFYKLSEKYELNEKNLIIVTNNLMSEEKQYQLIDNAIIKKNYKIYPFPYFMNRIFFSEVGEEKLNPKVKDFLTNQFHISLDINKTQKKEYNFISLNRSTRLHRIVICVEFLTNELFKNNFLISLMPTTNDKKHSLDFYNIVLNSLDDDYKFDKQRQLDFLFNFDSKIGIKYDTDETFSFNLTRNINRNALRKTFVNIVTETLYEENTIFITEKTVKSISCAQPFIILGNQHSLKKLKQMGFKTFEKWWDESYDEESNITRRIEKVIEIIREISTWDKEKCFKITQEMEGTFKHNFDLLMNDDEIFKFYDFLSF